MVAMMNKGLIPSTMNFPFVGEYAILSRGLRYNIELILFCKLFSFIFLSTIYDSFFRGSLLTL